MGNGQDCPNPLHTGERLRAVARANQLLFSFFNGAAARSERRETSRSTLSAKGQLALRLYCSTSA